MSEGRGGVLRKERPGGGGAERIQDLVEPSEGGKEERINPLLRLAKEESGRPGRDF